jgi:hypothetical protein
MTLRNYVADVVRCENTFILRNQQKEDDTGKIEQFGHNYLMLLQYATVRLQFYSQHIRPDVTAIYFALIGWKSLNWVTTGDKF